MILKIARAIVKDYTLLFLILIALSSFLGKFYMEAFYAISLSLWLWENKTSKYVLLSIVDHVGQLATTIIFGIILFYWYAVMTFFSTWRGKYRFEETQPAVSNYLFIYSFNFNFFNLGMRFAALLF
jgi:hypothetical protein